MAYLAIGHNGDTYKKKRWLPPRHVSGAVYISQSRSSDKWPSYYENDALGFAVRVPGTNDQGHSLVFNKNSNDFWIRFRAQNYTTSYGENGEPEKQYTQRIFTLKSHWGTPVVWLEEDNDTYEIRLCTVTKSIVLPLPINTAFEIDLKIAFNDFRLYIDGVFWPFPEQLQVYQSMNELEFGDTSHNNHMFWRYQYVIVSEQEAFGHEVKTIHPYLNSPFFDNWRHADVPDFNDLHDAPQLDIQYFSRGDGTEQTMEFKPITDKGEIKAVQLNGCFHTGRGKVVEFIDSVFENKTILADPIAMREDDRAEAVTVILDPMLNLHEDTRAYGFQTRDV